MPEYRAQFDLLDAGGELVTATRRQAHELARAHTARQRALGRLAWETPRIVPLPAWLERAWRGLAREGRREVLLDPLATARAWERLVADSPAGRALLAPRAAGRGAARAWQLVHEWHLDLDAVPPATEEQQAFRQWSHEWRARAAEHGWVDAAPLPALVARALGAGGWSAGRIGFHGFESRTPARAALVSALEHAGRTVEEHGARVTAGALATHAAESPDAELEAVASWLVARLAARPDARLAVVIPDLATRWRTVQRVLDDRLAPERLVPGAPDERPYALASGPRLADYAVADAALLLVGLGEDRVGIVEAGRLLRSPYLRGAAVEATRRAALDAVLRRAGQRAPRPDELATLAAAEAHPCPEFAAAVAAVRSELADRGRRPASHWALAIERALACVGWPDGRALSSAEFQAAHKFRELLAAVGALERVLPALTLAEVLAELRAVVADTAFQPEAGDPPVLVLDALAAPGLEFDGLWVAGLTADAFPAAAAPDPFLPVALQRAGGLPHASAELELAHARRTLAAWRECAGELVLSWPVRDADGTRLASPLLPRVPALELGGTLGSRAQAVRAAARRVAWQDRPLPPLPARARLHGGVEVIALQSACPFRAGVEQRLGARPLERPRVGLDPRDRGTVAHVALAAFWRDVRTQRRLRELGAEGRALSARRAIEEAVLKLPPGIRDSRLVALERAWLERAILALCEAELERAEFEVVEREGTRTLSIGGHPLEVRVDRIDRLADGATAVIDYKTGQGRLEPARWTGTRPDQPQMPTYAAWLDETPVAVAFARLALASVGFAGLSARAGLLPGVRTTADFDHDALRDRPWDSLIEEWRRVTTELVLAHARGVADVDPAPRACDHCRLAGLCRIEAALADAGEADGEGTNGEETGTGDGG